MSTRSSDGSLIRNPVTFPALALQSITEPGGAADTYCAVAYGQVDEIIAHIKATNDLAKGDDEEWRG